MCLNQTFIFSSPSKIEVFGKNCILMPGRHGLRSGGIFCEKNFISQKVKVSPGTRLKRRIYSVCDIKLETKVISLHKIEVVKISSFF